MAIANECARTATLPITKGKPPAPPVKPSRTRAAAGIVKREILDRIGAIVAKGMPQAVVNILGRLKLLFNWAVERDMLPGINSLGQTGSRTSYSSSPTNR